MSALIWAAIVAVWGFVLIPMWLRRHDSASEQRSTERFTVAMRVLSRRPAGHDEADPEQFDSDHERLGGVRGTGMSQAESPRSRDPIVAAESASAGRPAAPGESGWRDAPPGQARDSYAARVSSRPDAPVDSDDAGLAGPAGRQPSPAPEPRSAAQAGPGTSGVPATAGVSATAGQPTTPGGPGTPGGRATSGRPATLGWPGTPGGPGTSGGPATSGGAGSLARSGASGGRGSAGDDGATRGGERVDSHRTIALHRVAAERAALMRVRRQRLILLAAVFPLSVVLAAVFGGMWIAVQLLADLGLAGYLIHLRRAAQVERRLAITRVSIERRIEAERVARSRRRPIGSSFAYHERDSSTQHEGDSGASYEQHSVSQHEQDSGGRPERGSGSTGGERHGRPQPAAVLTPEELAHARAETIDLGGLMAAQHAYRDDAGQDEQPAPTRWTGGAGYDATGYDATGYDATGYDAASYDAAGYDAASYDGAGYDGAGYDGVEYDGVEADTEVEMAAGEVATASAARLTARPAVRPANRPTTSRPGRVQINPPGTHGGLIASPEADLAGDPVGENPVEIDPLLRRHAVGS